MKLYFLMTLIAAITAASRYKEWPFSAKPQTDNRAPDDLVPGTPA